MMTVTPEFPCRAQELLPGQLFRLPHSRRVHMVREITRFGTGRVRRVVTYSRDRADRPMWFGPQTSVIRVTSVNVQVQALALSEERAA